MVQDLAPYRYVCPRCHRSVLFFWQPTTEPACRRHRRRWSFGAVSMIRV